MDLTNAIQIAKAVRKNSYSPYGKYYVGCALMCKSGKIYSGCNIENDGIQSICAERVAFTKAISEGERDFEYIVKFMLFLRAIKLLNILFLIYYQIILD